MKKIMAIAAAALTASVLITGCGAGSKTAMKVGDIKITQGDISILTTAYLQRTGNFDYSKEQAVKSAEAAAKAYALCREKGLELTDEEQSQLRQGKASFAMVFGSASEYKKELRAEGADEDFVEMVIAQPLYEEKLKTDAALQEPSEDEAKEYFKENYRRAKHVLLSTDSGEDEELIKERAENILERAQNGESFDDLVKNFSEDPGCESNPDGYVFTDGDMVEEFDEAVKSIQPGEFTLCKSDFGYHVVQRLALDENDPKFNEFWEANKTYATTAKQTKDLENAIQQMADEAGITVEQYDDVIEAIASPTPVPTTEPTDEPAADEDTATEAPAAE